MGINPAGGVRQSTRSRGGASRDKWRSLILMEQAKPDQTGANMDAEGLWLAVFQIDHIPKATGVTAFMVRMALFLSLNYTVDLACP